MNLAPGHLTNGAGRRRIYLLRHGTVASAGEDRRYIGVTDLDLDESGRQQARFWADRFAGAGLEAVYCSPLSRCRETARIIGDRCGLVPAALPALGEINLGAWEGRRMKTIRTLYPGEYVRRGQAMADFRPPGGESFGDLQRRAWPAFEELAARHRGAILAVTHAGVIRVLLCRLLEMPLDRLFRIGQAHGALTIIDSGNDGLRLEALNLPSAQTD